MQNIWNSVDWGSVLTSIISSLTVTFITALVGVIFVKRYLAKLNFSNKLVELGFVNTSTIMTT